ncbi:hypothetical protein [Synechococcus sp. CS-1328]|uniref:hypothetical protein n=1 Tax=Synechococcus sp. CS-1328 TaxID=2847976 RepID=UPI00223AAEC4|nr:hypothetical protein [Synechococcus sp. CS-1328]MCT0225089.1 hypothetical protein [Synechococcus sp. CS-1328]
MRLRAVTVLVPAVAGILLSPCAARAHALESSLERLSSLNDNVMLQSHFSSGAPVAEALVRLMPPGGGDPILVGRTDTQGQLRFQLPASMANAEDWEVQVDGGSGHRDYIELPAKSDNQVRQGTSPIGLDAAWQQELRSPGVPLITIGLASLGGLLSVGSLVRLARLGSRRRG